MRQQTTKTVRRRVKVWQGARTPCFSLIFGQPPIGEIEFNAIEGSEQPQRGPRGSLVIEIGDEFSPVPLGAEAAVHFARAEMLGMRFIALEPPVLVPIGEGSEGGDAA